MSLTAERLKELIHLADLSSNTGEEASAEFVRLINAEFEKEVPAVAGLDELKGHIKELTALLDARQNNLYTVFCRQANNVGTTWIGVVEADGPITAKIEGLRRCSEEWGWEDRINEIRVLGLAKGDVQIIHWSDLDE